MLSALRRLRLPIALLALLIVAVVVVRVALAAVTVTAATGGTGISADKAANATTPGWTTLGNMVIEENNDGDFASSGGANRTIVLSAPSGWNFNAGVGSVRARINGNILTSPAPTINVTATAITVTLAISGTNRDD